MTMTDLVHVTDDALAAAAAEALTPPPSEEERQQKQRDWDPVELLVPEWDGHCVTQSGGW
jgi:hypothetical protein